MAEARDVVDPLVGSTLGKDYRVIEPIGFGGMAVVYMVEHQTLLKNFAAKVLSTELTANREARARFTQEAHAASQLDHENIVNISDFGVTSDGRPFFVMELLRGKTLGLRLTEGAMSLEEIIAIMIPVGRALAYAHAEGIVHRDVKPENIFLVQRSQGRFGIKVVDFGIAKTPVNPRLTKMGETLGSPLYMAPEACRGEDVDHRADQYSFGIILYQMLVGRLPFEDENLLKVLQLQVTAPLPPPLEVNPDLPPELAAILERALAKDPSVRYDSMELLLAELEASLPPGADRMLIEVQTGTTTAMRATPFPGSSQPIRVVRSSQSGLPALAGISTTPASTVVSQPPAKKNKLYLIVGLLALAALALVLVLVLGGKKDAKETTKPAVADKTEPTVTLPATKPTDPAPATPTEPPAATDPGSAATTAPPVAATTIRLDVKSDPDGARVFLGDEAIGTTPLSIERPRGSGTEKLVLKKSGYTTVEKSIALGEDFEGTIALARVASVTPPPTKKRTPPELPKKAGSGSGQQQPSLDIKLTR